ncbi:ubiquitin carboxyl-terminal hydrolase 47 isoform X2 [Hypomesus transpacificus]|uniref:ubiquitin carboxyl-terminal hydrolase 47 isoform X2 n=1 Tax=Hypomesus transpacificus TaxID=137520 RepID=UPI001F087046|nr:ubiquitin carboxyl-terminal hydrolase 47 isoform X2 [Hypomesus transpacificus]
MSGCSYHKFITRVNGSNGTHFDMANSRVGQCVGNQKDTSVLEKLRQKLSSIGLQDRDGCGYHGLVNQGNTCYLNSLLQVLFMTKAFREAVKRPTSVVYQDKNTFHEDLKELFERLETGTTTTNAVTQALGIENGISQQCDAAEYFEKILNKTDPHLSQIFRGTSRHTTKCMKCFKTIVEEIAFWTLPLSMNNVKDGIDLFFKPSTVSGKDQIYCEKCDAKRNATIECNLKHHPEVLTLLLKRFEFNNHTMSFVKTDGWVDVPQILKTQSCTYELYAVLNHFGSLRFGHYTATIKSFEDGLWYEFDDTNVFTTSIQSLVERYKNAYMLMYRKEKEEVGQRKGDDQQMSCERLLREYSMKGKKGHLVFKVYDTSKPAGLDVSTTVKTKVEMQSVTDCEINRGMDLSSCISACSVDKSQPRQTDNPVTDTRAKCTSLSHMTLKSCEERVSKKRKLSLGEKSYAVLRGKGEADERVCGKDTKGTEDSKERGEGCTDAKKRLKNKTKQEMCNRRERSPLCV